MAHEYGGGWYAVDGETVYFSNVEDGRIYRQESGAAPKAITEAGPFRYGDLFVDRAHLPAALRARGHERQAGAWTS